MGNKVYDIKTPDAARRLGVSEETIKRWARSGKLDGRKVVSQQWVFAEADLDAMNVRAVVGG